MEVRIYEIYQIIDENAVREKKVAEIIQELKRTKYNESEDSIGIHQEESPFKQSIISDSLNRFDNKIIMVDPIKSKQHNMNNSMLNQNSTKEISGRRTESPAIVRPITEPKESKVFEIYNFK